MKQALDWRAVLIAVIAAAAGVEPAFAFRYGAVTAGVILLCSVRTFRPGLPDWLATILTTFGIVSNLWTVSPSLTLLASKNQLAILAIFVAVRAVVRNAKTLATVGIGYLTGCLYTLYLLQANNATMPSLEFTPTGDRIGITGLNPNYSAYVLATGAVIIIMLWRLSKHRWQKLALASVYVLLYVGIVQTGTRGALVGLIGLTLWIVVYRIAPRKALVALYAVVIVASICIVTGLTDPYLRLAKSAREVGDLNGRLTFWPSARTVFSDHLFIGAGQNSFSALNPYRAVAAHNALLELGTGLGLVGVTLFVATLHAALVRSTRKMTDERERALVVGAMLCVSVPIFLSGVWDQSPAAWVAIGLVSVASVISLRRGEVAPADDRSVRVARPVLGTEHNARSSTKQI